MSLSMMTRLSGVVARLRRDPQEREHDLSQMIYRGDILNLLLQSHEWKRGLKPLLDEMQETFSMMLQRGNEMEPDMEKARGALDCLRKIHTAIAEGVAAGHKAQQQLTKLKERTNARRTERS